uniref:Uncharacterized protein n=1 Tax=Acrobeloides nanus TaxID=290746 RepID=A0A914CXU0_9BILA
VFAVDSDSEHFGKVSYALNGDDGEFFDIQDDGTVILMKELDFEKKSSLRVNIRASDGGEPQLFDETILVVTVTDVNDNPPIFEICPLSAVVQEGIQPGQALLTVVLTDSDSEDNGGRFRLELAGEGADAFSFDTLMNLITTRQLFYTHREQYDLNVTAYDAQGLSTTCLLTIYVKQQSRHPPEIQPLLVMLNTLHGEFLGGPIGRVKAIDKDPSDMLRFSIVDTNTAGSPSQPKTSFSMHSARFFIDPATGDLTAQSDILPGLHRFNVSVTDGRYIVYAPVDVDVSNIDQDALDHSVSIRIKRLSAEKFIKSHMRRFYESLAHILGVPVTNVRILSIQNLYNNATHPNSISSPGHAIKHRHRRDQSLVDLDVLFTVSRGESRGYHRPSFVKQRIERSINELLTESGLEIVSLTSEVCRRDVCLRGECRDRLWLENVDLQTLYDVDGTSFVSPRHIRTFECICRQGYAGRHCDVSVNKCSKEQCAKHEARI